MFPNTLNLITETEIMGIVKPHNNVNATSPSTFALLIDNINKMSESEQKALWLQINKEKIGFFAKEIDASVTQHNFNDSEIDNLINEAIKNGRGKKKN